MWFNPLFRKAVFQLGRNAEILFLAFTYCLYGVRGQGSVILLCGSRNGLRVFRFGRKCWQPLWRQSWGCLECHLGSLCSAVGGDRLDGKELETRLPPLDSSIWEKRRTDLAYSHSYQSFLFTVKKQVYSNVVLSSYVGQNSSGTLLEESHRKEAVWIESRALQMWVAWSDRQKML